MKKTALLFPGQGQQYVGMGRVLYEQSDKFKKIFDEANDILEFNLSKLMFEGPIQELERTAYLQPAVFTVGYAMYQYLEDQICGNDNFYAGYSLGEYTALCCSGAISFQEGLILVHRRGNIMEQARGNREIAMASIIGAEEDWVEELCHLSAADGLVCISGFNAERQVTVSGDKKAVDKVVRRAEEAGSRVVYLKVSGAFHSPLMEEAREALEREIDKCTWRRSSGQVISNLTGRPYQGIEEMKETLSLHLVSPVRWKETMSYLAKQDIDCLIDVGPSRLFEKLYGSEVGGRRILSLERENGKGEIIKTLAPAEDRLKMISRALAIAVCLKNNNDDENAYEEGVIRPYREVQALFEHLKSREQDVEIEHMQLAMNMLQSVIKTKKVPAGEGVRRIREILCETNTQAYFTKLAQ